MATKQSDYSESSIRVLKGLEPVKQRPGMYTRTENPLHIIQEVIDNASDEALGGHGKNIIITINADTAATPTSYTVTGTNALTTTSLVTNSWAWFNR